MITTEYTTLCFDLLCKHRYIDAQEVKLVRTSILAELENPGIGRGPFAAGAYLRQNQY
jgi:hypothetical protein